MSVCEIHCAVRIPAVSRLRCSGACARPRVFSASFRRLRGVRVRDDPGVVVHASRVAQRRDVQAHGVRGRNLVLSRHLRPTGHKLVRVDVVLHGLVVANGQTKNKI